MADPFKPRFVDLVRNFTETAGTGNLVLGDAAPGFTGFEAALQPGDSFYYSVAGLEKTSESEVGRGTLQADGTISRDAIGGTLTNFSQGRKTVALVAAAEWYEAMDSARSAPRSAATRAGLAALPAGGAALLTESGREGAFQFVSGNLSSQVAADPAQALHVAPASDPSGASGAWVRQFDGAVKPEWFGVVQGDFGGSQAAANDAAIAAMFATLSALGVNKNNVSGIDQNQGVYAIQFGLGHYEFSALFELNFGTVVIEGVGSGHGAANKTAGATKLKFYNSTGIRVQHSDTSGETTWDGVAHMGAGVTAIRDLDIEGNFSGTEAEYYGIHARAAVHVEHVNIRNFAGDGRRIEADVVTKGGNTNSSTFIGGEVWRCRNGHRVLGNNSNTITVIGGRYAQNRQWGIWDSCTLGNYYYGVHTTRNGNVSGSTGNNGTTIPAATVSHGGNWYYAIVGEEAWASANAPSGTTADNQGWAYQAAGTPESGVPAWFAGISVRAGGTVHADVDGSPNIFTGYTEQNQGKAQIYDGSLVIGGIMTQWCHQNATATKGTSIIKSMTNAVVDIAPAAQVSSGTVTVKLGAPTGNINKIGLGIYDSTYAPSGHELFIASTGSNTTGDLLLSYNHSIAVSTYALQLTGPGTSLTFGRGALQPNCLYLPRLFVGPSGPSARQLSIDSAAPSAGERGQGDWVLARDSDANRIGWKTTAAGTPGTQREIFGLSQLVAAGSGLAMSGSDRLLGRSSAGNGAVEEIACTAAGRAILDDADASAQRTTLGLRRGWSFHCSGAPAGGEVIGGGIAPYAMTVSAAGSVCKALVAATGATTLTIKNNGTVIGQIDFAAGATAGVVSLAASAIAAGDHLTVHNAAAADATLADIDGLLAE